MAYEKLAETRQGESSKNIRERVARARQVQEQRFRNSSSRNNSGMNRKEMETQAEFSGSSRKTSSAGNDQNGFERLGIRSDSQSYPDYCRPGR